VRRICSCARTASANRWSLHAVRKRSLVGPRDWLHLQQEEDENNINTPDSLPPPSYLRSETYLSSAQPLRLRPLALPPPPVTPSLASGDGPVCVFSTTTGKPRWRCHSRSVSRLNSIALTSSLNSMMCRLEHVPLDLRKGTRISRESLRGRKCRVQVCTMHSK
jgi:hypothetical protein